MNKQTPHARHAKTQTKKNGSPRNHAASFPAPFAATLAHRRAKCYSAAAMAAGTMSGGCSMRAVWSLAPTSCVALHLLSTRPHTSCAAAAMAMCVSSNRLRGGVARIGPDIYCPTGTWRGTRGAIKSIVRMQYGHRCRVHMYIRTE